MFYNFLIKKIPQLAKDNCDDEYLVKLLSANIFSVRIAALFKHYVKAQAIDENSKICVGDLTLSPFAHKCQVGQHAIALTQFEFKLLCLLADNVGKIMTRDYIYQSLLGREYNGSEIGQTGLN